MARASNVYVVVWADGVRTPAAAFTVKHECQYWLEHQVNHTEYNVWRLPDGPADGRRKVWTAVDFLED